jgi:negative regulator of sigma E activity
VGRRLSMADDTEADETKKKGFFGKLMKIAVVAAVVAAVASFVKRRRGQDLDDVEWQEPPPRAGG